MKKLIRQMISLMSALLILISVIPIHATATEAAAVPEATPVPENETIESPDTYKGPEPISDLRFTSKIVSYDENDEPQVENISSVTTSSKSLWYNDGDLARNVVTTYNNNGAVKHYRDKIEVYVYQKGQGTTSTYDMVNGKRQALSGTIDKVVSSYPDPFIVVWKYTITKEELNPDEPYTILTVGIIETTHPGSSTPYTRREANLYIYWDTTGMSAAPNVSFVYDDAQEKMMLSGATSAMEYRRKSDSAWTPCTDAPMYFDSQKSDVTYFVRYAASADGNPSQVQEIVLPGLRSQPNISYNTSTETLSGLSTDMEIKINEDVFKDATETSLCLSEVIDKVPSGSSTTVTVRYKATETQPAGAEKVITLYARSEQPSTLTFDPIALTLSGGSSSMEYKGDIVGLSNGDYHYSTNKSSWTEFTVTDGRWNVSSLLSASTKMVYLRYAETSTTPVSNYTTFELQRRPTAPTTPAFVYNDSNYPEQVLLTGITSDMQYRMADGTDWIDITGEKLVFDIPDTSVTYYIRTKSTTERWASVNKSLTLSQRPSAPSCTYSSNKETISGLSTTMEMSINGEPYEPVTGTTYSVSSLIDSLSSGESMEIKIRTKATTTAPASKDKVITLNARTLKMMDLM